jgi:hypothetical protein
MLVCKFIQVVRSIFIVGLMNVSVLIFALYFGATEAFEEYSKYVLSFSLFSVLTVLFDLGLNISVVRETSKRRISLLNNVIFAKFFLCLIVIVVILLMQLIFYSFGVNNEHILAAIFTAAIYNYWLTVRVKSQMDLNFAKYDSMNLIFMLLRLFYILIFVIFEVNVSFGLLFLYAFPALTFILITEARYKFVLNIATLRSNCNKISNLSRYGLIVMSSALVYTVCMNSTVFFFTFQSNAKIVAGVGWAMAPVALITLVFAVLRPFWLSYTSQNLITIFQLKLILFFILMVAVVGGTINYFIQDYLGYVSDLLLVPVAWIRAAMISFLIMSIICSVGLVSSLLHRLNKPRWDLFFNLLRLFLIVMALLFIRDSNDVAFILSLVLSIVLLCEIVLAFFVYRTYKRVYL